MHLICDGELSSRSTQVQPQSSKYIVNKLFKNPDGSTLTKYANQESMELPWIFKKKQNEYLQDQINNNSRNRW